MPEETQVHVVRHGEVHNPTGMTLRWRQTRI